MLCLPLHGHVLTQTIQKTSFTERLFTVIEEFKHSLNRTIEHRTRENLISFLIKFHG